MKELLTHTEGDPGKTGSFNPAKAIGVFTGLLVVAVSLSFFGILLPPLPMPITFSQWITGTFAMGVMSAGFYHGLGKGVFKKLAEAYVNRASK